MDSLSNGNNEYNAYNLTIDIPGTAEEKFRKELTARLEERELFFNQQLSINAILKEKPNKTI